MAQPRRISKYELLEEVGRGGFAVVYQARDTVLDRIVALKVLHPYWAADAGFVARFHREARAVARLRHANIVTVYDAGEAEGQLYIAMEYLPGRTLRALLEAEGALSLDRALPVLEQVGEALDHAHGQGVVHRDVKPGNVMVEETERGVRATLMDFGLVKAMTGSSVLTSHGTLLGSPEYMAPEQADPERAAEIGPAADRYALGIVAYQMLAGRVPFPGNTPATLNAHEHKPVPPPRTLRPDLSEPLAAALVNMLAKVPADRFASARAFIARLREALLAERQVREREAQLTPLYERLQAAAVRKDWAEVLAVGGQIRTLDSGYRNVPELVERAKAQMRRPRCRPRPERKIRPLPGWAWAVAALVLLGILYLGGQALGIIPTFPLRVPALGDTMTRQDDGMVMVYVPAGEFEMGSTEGDSDEQPVHTVVLDHFWIDRTEVTNAQYRRCVEAGNCSSPPVTSASYTRNSYYFFPNDGRHSAYVDYPVINVTWYQAADYCAWAWARLPTEAEWEYAARGPEGCTYPWGDGAPDCSKANYGGVDDGCVGDTRAVGSYPARESWCDALDMAGNVWEWMADRYGDYPSGRQANPTGPSSGERRVLRGGSWDTEPGNLRGANRDRNTPDDTGNSVGFRCARSYD